MNDSGTSIPGTGTALPNNNTGTAVPGTGSALPNTGTAVPKTGTAVPNAGTGTGIPQAAPSHSGRLGSTKDIPELPEYLINGIRYKLVKPINVRSGEARVFVVENGGKQLALKIYITGHAPDTEILNKIQQAKGGFIVNLYDHGHWDDPAQPGKAHYYEVMEYAPYGSLADVKIKSEQQFKEIAMRMAFCINQSHSLNIIHRDIKPENFLFTDQAQSKFVLCDFGIARTIKNKDSRVSVDNAKSGFFVSPEGAMTANNRTSSVGLATDYYSMGMTLLAMWMGVSTFYKTWTEDELLEYKQENKIIEECGSLLKLSAYSKSLLSALVEFRPSDRANFNDIERWFNGETLKSKNAQGAGAGVDGFRVVFNETKNKIATTPEELAKMMLEDLEYAKMFLYRDIAKNALQQTGRTALALAIDDITQKLYPGRNEQDAGVFAACLKLDKSLPYIGLSGKRCSSATEIAAEVWGNRTKYVAELKHKGSRLWAFLNMRGDDKLKKAMSTYQPIIARSEIHGVFALCLELNPSMPYYGKNNKPCVDEKQVADEIWSNLKTYQAELVDSDHMLWQYMRTWNASWRDIANKYPGIMAKDNVAAEIHTFNLVYLLDPTKPFTIQFADDKKWHAVSSFDEILNNVGQHGITDFSVECFSRQHFVTWLMQHDATRGALLEKNINSLGANVRDNVWWLFYLIAPEIDLTLQRNSKNPIATAEQIGKELNSQLNGFAPTGGPASINLIDQLTSANFRTSRLNQYLYARKMKAHADGIAKIMDINANTKAHLAAPYDSTTALWKVVEYLGHRPTYYIKSTKKYVASPDDVRKLSNSEISSEINKGLAQYLTIFFHEKAGQTYSFDKLQAYHDFISAHCPLHSGIQRSADISTRVNNAINSRDKAWRSLSVIRTCVMLFCLVPMIAILGWMIYMSFTDGSEALSHTFMAIGNVIAIILAIGGALICLEGGIIGAIIGGLIGYWVPMWIFGLLSSIAPFIVAGLVIAAAAYLVIKLFKFSKDSYITSQADYDNYVTQAKIYMVCEAFGTTRRAFGSQNVDPSEAFNRSRDIAKSQKKSVYKAAAGMVVLAAATLGIGLLLMNNIDEGYEYAAAASQPLSIADVEGTYNGTFHERDAKMTLSKSSGKYDFTGEVVIQYSPVMTQEVVGNYNENTGELQLKVIVDGSPSQYTTYQGKLLRKGYSDSYSGVYKNAYKGTQHNFTFSK